MSEPAAQAPVPAGETPSGGTGRPDRRRRRLAVHAATGVWMLVMTAALLIPRDPDLGDHFRWLPVRVDRAAHFLLFFVCCLMLHRSARLERLRFSLLSAAVASVAYGLLTETLQHFLPHRGFEVVDGIADALGVAFYVALAVFLERRRGLEGRLAP